MNVSPAALRLELKADCRNEETMPTLQSLRRNIAALTNIHKITRTMKMTAAAEYGARIGTMDIGGGVEALKYQC
jgi:hypothetical protein